MFRLKFLYLFVLFLTSILDKLEATKTKNTSNIETVSKNVNSEQVEILSSLLIVYDVDNVILDRFAPGRTTLNPEIVPLLSMMHNRRINNDKRLFLPRIFSHGCGTSIKFSEIVNSKGRFIVSTNMTKKKGESFPFYVKIENIGTAYMVDNMYFLQKDDEISEFHAPLDILSLFFADTDEHAIKMPVSIPYTRILERKAQYGDVDESLLTNHEYFIFKNFIMPATRATGVVVPKDYLPDNFDEQKSRVYIMDILKKVLTINKVWPFEVRNFEIAVVKDMVKYRNYLKKFIPKGTTIVLLDDLVYHFNFACMHEHFSSEYKVLVIVVKKFMDNNNRKIDKSDVQKQIVVPIGGIEYVPYRLREIQGKFSNVLNSVPINASSSELYTALRNEFLFGEPDIPQCGYDIINPSTYYILFIIDCDFLYNMVRLFIEDKMVQEISYVLSMTTHFATLSNRRSCNNAFLLVKGLILAGYHEWSNKILPLPHISGVSGENDTQTQNQYNDKHIFMSKFYSRLPRSRTIALRLDFQADSKNVQHTDYTCFISYNIDKDNVRIPSKSNIILQKLLSLKDEGITKSLNVNIIGGKRTAGYLKKLNNVFSTIDKYLETPKESSSFNSIDQHQIDSSYYDNEEDGGLEQPGPAIGSDISFVQLNNKKFAALSYQEIKANPTTFPTPSNVFLSFFSKLISSLKDEFGSSYLTCIAETNIIV